MRVLVWVLFVVGVLMPSQARAEEPRVALIIGNSRYESSPLANPARDAELMSRTLKAVGFDVATLIDGDQKQMKAAIRDFGQKLNGGIALFYYAGHGMQVNGNNYLIPVRAKIDAEVDVDVEAVNVSAVLAAMEKSKSVVNIVILDACRDNPFARETRSGVRGLAFVNAPSGTLISYATAPGSVASDGAGQNGTFTASLSKHVGTPGLALEEMFKRVRSEVKGATHGRQVPWESSSLTGSFAFVRGGDAPVVVAPSSPPPAPLRPDPSPAVNRAPGSAGDRPAPMAVVADQGVPRASGKPHALRVGPHVALGYLYIAADSSKTGPELDLGTALSFGASDRVDVLFHLVTTYGSLSDGDGSEETDLGGSVGATLRWLPTNGSPRWYLGAGPQVALGWYWGSEGSLDFSGNWFSLSGALETGLLFGSKDEWDLGLRGAQGFSKCLEAICPSFNRMTLLSVAAGHAF